ncbi:MAG: threonine/serine dehydratase [Gammaproteobacteria bacterium]|nr:threonine/serine dehydratase [Gammaproteobacteria bacterium]NNL49438.1 threonine/serine dehydratase [Woeseiaceae bacterium]
MVPDWSAKRESGRLRYFQRRTDLSAPPDIARTANRAQDALQRIRGFVLETPLVYSAAFSKLTGASVHFKLENRQTTGSFKLRGASNRLLTLTEEQRSRGCVAASSGNHGAAVACAMQKLGTSGIIFVPEETSSAKVDAIKRFGGEVEYFGTDGLETEQHARDFADRKRMTYLSPYNDEQVIAGQGTCGVEIVEQLPDVDTVFVAVGGGGLIAGAGSVLKVHNPGVRVIGCQPAASPVMARSIEAGRVIEIQSQATLSDGTAGGIETGAITFPLNQAIVDDFVLVDEEQIAAAMRLYMDTEGDTIEGAAGVAVAAMIERKASIRGQNVVVIICGGNISDTKLEQVRSGNQ